MNLFNLIDIFFQYVLPKNSIIPTKKRHCHIKLRPHYIGK